MEHLTEIQNRNLVASIYKRYYTDVRCYFQAYTHNRMAAEDMTQDLFFKVMNIDTISGKTARNLLFVMAKRMIIDDARHKTFVREVEKDMLLKQDIYASSPAQRIEAANILSLVTQHLDTLAPKRSHIYKMYKYDGMTTDEISQQLSLSKRTVETHLYLSSKEMKEYLKKIG